MVAVPVAIGVAYLIGQSERGGDPVDPTEGEPPGAGEVRDAIETAVETRNAEDCERLATPAYLRQYERRGRSALAACQRGLFERDRGLLPSDVGIEVVEVGEDGALALVTYREGGAAGITARQPFVRDREGRWVLAPVQAYESATRGQMDRALGAELAAGPVPFGAPAARCAVRSLRGLSDAQMQRLLLRGSAAEAFGPVARCDRRAFARGLVGEIREAGFRVLPARETCLAERLAEFPADELVDALEALEERGRLEVPSGC